jgi:DNA-binding XRE family transcriptional regulator
MTMNAVIEKKKASTFRQVETRKALAGDAKQRPALWAANNAPDDIFWIGTNLHRLRLEQKLAQAALARKAGIGVRTLRDLESATANSNPTVRTLAALACELGVKTMDLYARNAQAQGVRV